MKNNLLLCFLSLFLILGCDSDDGTAGPILPVGGGDGLPSNCNVEVTNVNRITDDEVTDDAKIGDYFITIKNVNTIKEKITIEVLYFIGTTAEATVTVSTTGSVAIDETIEFKISSDDINTEEDWVCIQYFVKVEAENTRFCQYDLNDC